MYSVVVAFGLASVMLCIGMAIRAKVKFFQHMLMPVSVIGGILGFILMNLVLSKYPVGGVSVTDFSNIVDVFFVMSFISIGLTGGKKKKNKKTEDGTHLVYFVCTPAACRYFNRIHYRKSISYGFDVWHFSSVCILSGTGTGIYLRQTF